jgi:hypothetical protein
MLEPNHLHAVQHQGDALDHQLDRGQGQQPALADGLHVDDGGSDEAVVIRAPSLLNIRSQWAPNKSRLRRDPAYFGISSLRLCIASWCRCWAS